jgi:hypothetical protein
MQNNSENPTIRDFIASIVSQAGVEVDLKDLDKPAPDELLVLKSNLITKDAARNDSDIKAHYTHILFHDIDNQVDKTLQEFGLPPEQIAEIKAKDRKTAARVGNIKKYVEPLIKPKEVIKEVVKTDPQREEYENALKTKVSELEQTLASQKEDFENKQRLFILETTLSRYLSGVEVAPELTAAIDAEELKRLAINKYLNENGCSLVVESGQVKVKQTADLSLDAINKATGKQLDLSAIVAEATSKLKPRSKVAEKSTATVIAPTNAPKNNIKSAADALLANSFTAFKGTYEGKR